MKGEIFDIKRFAVHDGPGIRCTAFLKGCPLDCVWCHNPEGKRSKPEICSTPNLCIGCGKCEMVCEKNAVKKGALIDRAACARCGSCAGVCAAGALSVRGREISADELLREFEKERVFFQTSGGGITLSGGDPLYQPEFTKAVLEKSKASGFHTALETCLYGFHETVLSMIELVDLWICDIKIMDEEAHKTMTGRSNKKILSNYEYLAKSGVQLLTRIPVIPGLTDSEENLTAIGKYTASVNPGGKTELMFYNPLGVSKYNSFGFDYKLTPRQYGDDRKEYFKMLVKNAGAEVVV